MNCSRVVPASPCAQHLGELRLQLRTESVYSLEIEENRWQRNLYFFILFFLFLFKGQFSLLNIDIITTK